MIKLVDNINEAEYITHAATMHADELFATAFLELYKKNLKLFRTNQINASDYKDKIIYDIGYGEFDHHMPDAKVRPNGIKYSSPILYLIHFLTKYLSVKFVLIGVES